MNPFPTGGRACESFSVGKELLREIRRGRNQMSCLLNILCLSNLWVDQVWLDPAPSLSP